MSVKTRKPKHYLQVGEKTNRLTMMRFDHQGKHGRNYYLFKCDCGNEKVLSCESVNSGNTKSCGCLATEGKKSKRVSRHHSELTAIILGYKRHALNRGFIWALSREDVKAIIKLDCFYCGAPPSNKKVTKNSLGNGLVYSGIDRIDSSLGYTPDNVVPCCKNCNYAKSNMTITQFHTWAIQLGRRAMAEQWGGK